MPLNQSRRAGERLVLESEEGSDDEVTSERKMQCETCPMDQHNRLRWQQS